MDILAKTNRRRLTDSVIKVDLMTSSTKIHSSIVNNGSNHTNRHHHGRSKHRTTVGCDNCSSTITMQIRWMILLIIISAILSTLLIVLNVEAIGIRTTNSSYMNTKCSWETTSNQIEHQQPFNENNLATKTTKLIIVAGHSVTISGHLLDANHDENDWYLLDYQKHHGLPEAITKHIEAGITHASKDSDALLIFSGGQTRATVGPESEGSSYYRVADVMNLWSQPMQNRPKQYIRGNDGRKKNRIKDPTHTVRARTITEEHATDSFQNLLFSICRFYEITGRYPTDITMISYTFKQHRFESLHVPALRWPLEKFHYVGVDPPKTSGFDLEESKKGELENAAQLFVNDPYGCYSNVLKEKRLQRNPFLRTPPYDISCPDMGELMHYCGTTLIDANQVPWSQ